MKYIQPIVQLLCLVLLATSFQDVFAQGVEIQSEAKMLLTGAAIIQIDNGNLINNGTYNKGAETVILSGSTAKEISGTSATSLNNLSVKNTGGITTKLSLLTTNALSIASDSKLTIDTVKTVMVSTSITNNAGTTGLLIKSSPDRANGTLIYHNAYESPVQATVEMYSKASKVSSNYKWQFFGIPVRSLAKSPTFVDGVSYVRRFNESGWYTGSGVDKHWIQEENGATLTAFTGYEVVQGAAKTYTFSGELVNSSYDSGQLEYTSTAQYPGQHLIGNPYTAAINISDIEFGSPLETIIENSVYLYNTGSLADWTSAGSGAASATESFTPGQYIVVPKNVANRGLGIPGQIPSMGAFLVKVKNYNDLGWVKISYPADDAGASLESNTTLQRSPSAGLPCTRIDVKGDSFSDRMWIFTEPTCTRGFDNGWDGYKESITSAAPILFAIEQSGNYQVNSVDNINNTKLGFVVGTGSDYTFLFTHQNIETKYPVLYLFDSETGEYTNITMSGTQYSFISSNESFAESRFKIVTSIDHTTEASRVVNSGLWLHNSQNVISIHNTTVNSGTLELFDMAGRMVKKIAFNANTITAIPTSISAGFYIAKAQTKTEKFTLPIIIK